VKDLKKLHLKSDKRWKTRYREGEDLKDGVSESRRRRENRVILHQTGVGVLVDKRGFSGTNTERLITLQMMVLSGANVTLSALQKRLQGKSPDADTCWEQELKKLMHCHK